jgi:hypothetical protein
MQTTSLETSPVNHRGGQSSHLLLAKASSAHSSSRSPGSTVLRVASSRRMSTMARSRYT